ncbi:1825_t:CDS:2 [Funneliformis geosporum]|nr:1825_t:CDS:2 [Funneliformis geosporum]
MGNGQNFVTLNGPGVLLFRKLNFTGVFLCTAQKSALSLKIASPSPLLIPRRNVVQSEINFFNFPETVTVSVFPKARVYWE